MNNKDFRSLVASTPIQANDASPSSSNGASRPGATPGAFGSRARSSIPMTPRTVKGSTNLDFARQLAERNATTQPQKKFRSSAAPKGSKLAEGYRDRAREREDDDQDDREARVKALEEQMKLGQIERDTFEQLRDQITGGDIGATHLVKGLDRRLLERVRRGEDVLSGRAAGKASADEDTPDADAELDSLEQREVAPVQREQVEKKGEMAPPPMPAPVAGVKRSRNDILAELKASRKAAQEAKEAAESQLGGRFKKIGGKIQPGSRIERDEKGREVLITIDENGKVKRKVRKIERPVVDENGRDLDSKGLLLVDKKAKPLGLEVPESIEEPVDTKDDDSDIFEGIGDDYDPLKGDGESEGDTSSEEGEVPKQPETTAKSPDDAEEASKASANTTLTPLDETKATSSTNAQIQASAAVMPAPKRNYFGAEMTSESRDSKSDAPGDATIMAAIKRASAIAQAGEAADDAQPTEKPSGAAQRLLARAQADRDYEDMDMGFGSSRGGDEEDADDGARIKLSEWKGGGGDEDEDEGEKQRGGGKQRKRGKKKRQGDKNNASDVLKIIEGRKKV